MGSTSPWHISRRYALFLFFILINYFILIKYNGLRNVDISKTAARAPDWDEEIPVDMAYEWTIDDYTKEAQNDETNWKPYIRNQLEPPYQSLLSNGYPTHQQHHTASPLPLSTTSFSGFFSDHHLQQLQQYHQQQQWQLQQQQQWQLQQQQQRQLQQLQQQQQQQLQQQQQRHYYPYQQHQQQQYDSYQQFNPSYTEFEDPIAPFASADFCGTSEILDPGTGDDANHGNGFWTSPEGMHCFFWFFQYNLF